MREIKFRGKRVDNGEWVYGYVYKVESKGLWFIDNGKTVSHQVIAETVGQFTGLYDKNGKEIYEGDIVEENEILSIVEYDNYGTYSPFGHGDYATISTWVTVIGNVHDNSELLK